MESLVTTLEEIAYFIERAGQSPYKYKAFRSAAQVVQEVGEKEIKTRSQNNTLQQLPKIGNTIAKTITEILTTQNSSYLKDLKSAPLPLALKFPEMSYKLFHKLKGDCHSHSDWSDGTTSIEKMALAAKNLGHKYIVISDHSPSLTIANGLNTKRLLSQLDVIADLNKKLSPFVILTGIEVDILPDGSLDQDNEILERLDIVVASVHSKLKMDRSEMTKRMVKAISNPHVDILGHCTGRKITKQKPRPQSDFDAEVVFMACKNFETAVEINSRIERRDPPLELLNIVKQFDCLVSIDTDAHAPGQLEWQVYGCEQAYEAEIDFSKVVNSWNIDKLRAWTTS